MVIRALVHALPFIGGMSSAEVGDLGIPAELEEASKSPRFAVIPIKPGLCFVDVT